MDRKLDEYEIEMIKRLSLSSRAEAQVMSAWREVPVFPPILVTLFIGVFIAFLLLLTGNYFGLISISERLHSLVLGVSWMFNVFLVMEISTVKTYLQMEEKDWVLTPNAMKTWRLGIGAHTRTTFFGFYGFFLSSVDLVIAFVFLLTVIICYFNFIFVRDKVENFIRQINQ